MTNDVMAVNVTISTRAASDIAAIMVSFKAETEA
jgi:hypothetical protein